MTRISLQTTCRLAAGLFLGVAAMAQVRAGETDFGVARVSDREKTVVRGQSPEAGILQTNCQNTQYYDATMHSAGACGNGNCPGSAHSSGEVIPGLHHSVSCPEHGGVYESDCPKCRDFAGFGEGEWTVDEYGNAVWCEPESSGSFGDRLCQKCSSLGDRFVRCLSRCDRLYGKNPQPLFGHYRIVYPVDPWYFDGRDSQAYAAQTYGGPVSVPLAPIVRQQYNYGWGIPSSRITPISRPLPYGVQQ